MAIANTKELAQCLAFAYFAENPSYSKTIPEMENEHATNFYSLFSGKVSVSNLKSKYLSSQFPIDLVKADFAIGKTPKTGLVKYHDTARIVYKVARYCIEHGLFANAGNLKNYEFLDQNDSFVLLVKNTTLAKVSSALSFKLSVDMLSAVDVYFVLKSSKSKITKEFTDHFLTPAIIQRNSILDNDTVNDYTGLMNKYMNSKELLPISLKLPSLTAALGNSIHMRKVQLNPTDISVEIDPYIKFLSVILANPSKTKELIEQVIEIDIKNFITGRIQNWVFPVNFNYSKLKVDGVPLTSYDLKFNLFAQGRGAGWNGQFDKSSEKHQATQFVGGATITGFEIFAKSYPEYTNVIKSVVDRRIKIFKEMVDIFRKEDTENFKKNYESFYLQALSEISQVKVLSFNELKKLKFFCDTVEGDTKEQHSLYQTYLTRYIDATRGKSIKYIRAIKANGSFDKSTPEEKTEYHFVHAQISEFLFYGGVNTNMYFKQKLFLTLFGVITKKSHFKINDYAGMKHIIMNEFIHDKDQIIAGYRSAPHYIIS